jgi:hypothetical protein
MIFNRMTVEKMLSHDTCRCPSRYHHDDIHMVNILIHDSKIFGRANVQLKINFTLRLLKATELKIFLLRHSIFKCTSSFTNVKSKIYAELKMAWLDNFKLTKLKN